MKRLVAFILILITTLGWFVACKDNSPYYVGDYYSKEARAMNAEGILTIYDENNEQVFEIEYIYPDNTSTLIHGTYEVKNEKLLALHPEKKIIMINDIPAESEVDDKTPIEAKINGDIITLDGEMQFIKEGSKTAETDTTVKVTIQETKKEDKK